jgi:hypothetical protein
MPMANSLHTFGDGSMWKGALLLVVVCALLMAAGIASNTRGAPGTLPAIVLGDVSHAEMVEIRDHRDVAVLSGEFRSQVDIVGNIEKDAPLRDRNGEAVIGEVELEIPAPARKDRRPELEVDVIGLAPRQRYTLVIDDRVVGAFETDDRGSIDMELQEGELPLPGAQRPNPAECGFPMSQG